MSDRGRPVWACATPITLRTGIHPGNPKARLRRIKVAVADGDVVITVPEAREATPVMPEADISA